MTKFVHQEGLTISLLPFNLHLVLSIDVFIRCTVCVRHFVIQRTQQYQSTCYMHTLHIKMDYGCVVIFGFPCVDTQTVNFTLRSTLHNIDFGLVVDGVTFCDCSVRDK